MRSLLRIVNDLSSTLDVQSVLQKAIEGAVSLTGLQSGAIYLQNDDLLYLGATTPPLPEDFPEHLRYAPIADNPNVAEVLRTHEPSMIPDVRDADLSPSEREVCDVRGLRTILFVPLLAQRRTLGAFIVGSVQEPQPIPESDIALCSTLAYSIALAVDNARLFESVRASAAQLATAYDVELARRSRLRALAAALIEEEQQRDSWIAQELELNVIEPLEKATHDLRASEPARGTGTPHDRLRTALDGLAAVERAAQQLREEFISPPVEQGFLPALKWICARHLDDALDVSIHVDASAVPTRSPVDRLLVNAASEITRTIGEQSGRTQLLVTLSSHGDDLVLTVQDDGPPLAASLFTEADPHARRLFSLSERAAHFGGRLDIEHPDSGGNVVKLVLPAKEWDVGAD